MLVIYCVCEFKLVKQTNLKALGLIGNLNYCLKVFVVLGFVQKCCQVFEGLRFCGNMSKKIEIEGQEDPKTSIFLRHHLWAKFFFVILMDEKKVLFYCLFSLQSTRKRQTNQMKNVERRTTHSSGRLLLLIKFIFLGISKICC